VAAQTIIRSTLIRVEILPSARKHNVGDDDMVHAFENCLEWVEIGEDPFRYLTAGPDLSGNVIELVIVVAEDVELLIHAMPIRRSTEEALFGGPRE
jgi:hypothetical protein